MPTKPSVHTQLHINPQKLFAYSSGLLQGKAYRAMNKQVTSALSPYNLSVPEWKFLGQLYANGELSLGEIASLLSVEASAVTILVKRLIEKDMIALVSDPEDNRNKKVISKLDLVTLIPQIDQDVKAKMRILLQNVTPDELRTYIRVLEKIVDNA